MHAFLWDDKPGKKQREIHVLTKDYEQGGIKMIDLQKNINSLKCS